MKTSTLNLDANELAAFAAAQIDVASAADEKIDYDDLATGADEKIDAL